MHLSCMCYLTPVKDGSYAVASKGAAEQTLKLCTHIVLAMDADVRGVPITPEIQKKLEAQVRFQIREVFF